MEPNDVPIQYTPDEKMLNRIDGDFTYHAPIAEKNQVRRYAEIRERAREYAVFLLTQTPPSREQSLALTHLEEVVMWANAAIARNE
ncbi:MAG: Acb2/Tad1 domain-containing protein [Armatimonadota bacterium]